MKIERINIHNFRCFEDVSLHARDYTLLVGANNAGKSSILEAAGIVLRPPDPGQWVSAVRRRDSDMSLVDGIWSMFPGASTR